MEAGNGQPQPLIQLVKLENGTLAVNGPVDDLVIALGLLEVAKQLVIDHNKQKDAPRVVPVVAARVRLAPPYRP